VPISGDAKALPPCTLAEMAQQAGGNPVIHESLHHAITFLTVTNPAYETILVTGSLYLVGEALSALKENE
jgi:folylpolyglutamate synthase/dihydropteroate synthase